MPGQVSEDFFSSIDVPRGHTDGTMIFPSGYNLTVAAVTTVKHTWSKKVIGDAISAYVRGSTFLPEIPPIPVATVNWYQVWDNYGNGTFPHFEMMFRDAYTKRVLQRSMRCNT